MLVNLYGWGYAVCYEALHMGGGWKNTIFRVMQELESLFNKPTGLRPATLLERDFTTGILLWIFLIRAFYITPTGNCFCKESFVYQSWMLGI